MDIQHILVQLDAADGFIEEIESEMEVTLTRIPYSARILSMKGLGTVTVAGLIGEVGDFTKFRTQSEIMKLAGLNLYEISSGKRKGSGGYRKEGEACSGRSSITPLSRPYERTGSCTVTICASRAGGRRGLRRSL